MPILSNGCHTVNVGLLVKQNKFSSLSSEVEILAPHISGHKVFIVIAYIPHHLGKCKKVSYLTAGDEQIQVEFYDSKESLQPYRRQTYSSHNLPPKHLKFGKELLIAHRLLRNQYMRH